MKIFLIITVILNLFIVPQICAQKAQPNLLLILTDGVRRSEFGCYGATNGLTKNIDTLASRGVRFTEAYSAAPVALSSRMALLTGQHPVRFRVADSSRNGLLSKSYRLREEPELGTYIKDAPSLFKILTKAGYDCADFAELYPQAGVKKSQNLSSQGERVVNFLKKTHKKPWCIAVSLEDPSPWKIDAEVGKITSTLETLGLSSQTIVVLTSTHGAPYPAELLQTASTSYQPLNGQEGYLHEGGLRVPLIIAWAKHRSGGLVTSEATVTMDIFATLVEAAGVNAPSDLISKSDGLSLFPAMQVNGKLPRDFLCWHLPHYGRFGGEPASAIRMGNLKLIQFYEWPREELFDLSKDIGERRNIADSRKEDLVTLRNRLEAWKQALGITKIEPNPNYSATASADKSGIIVLSGSQAQVHGTLIRYEPQPHKNTVGYWANGKDWVSWQFIIAKPGRYEIELLQGCGTGGEGSDMSLSIGNETLRFVVQQTGHFQNFVSRKLGQLRINETGLQTLALRAETKRGGAVMDVRQIRLIPVGLSSSSLVNPHP